MRIIHSRIVKLFSAGLLAFTLGACANGSAALGPESSEGDADIQGDASGIGQPIPPVTAPDGEPELAPITPRDLTPHEEFHNILWGMSLDEESQRIRWKAYRTRAEDLMAYCMNRLGFEYIPFLEWQTIGFDNELRPDDADWVAQYGFGWTTNPPRGDGGSMNFFTPGNPNIEIFESLSEAGQRAYWGALQYRSHDFARVFDDSVNWNCRNWSSQIANNEREVSQREEFAPLMAAIEQMHDDLRWDISDADRAYASCMWTEGFPGLERQWEASDKLLREMNDLRVVISANPNWSAGTNPTPENSPEMAALRDRELAMAIADYDCRISTDFAAARAAHIAQVELQFITDHQAALAALRAASEQQ